MQITVASQAQQKESKDEQGGLFELQLGAVDYSYFNVLAPSVQFNLATPLGKYFSLGVLLNGYSAIAPATTDDKWGNEFSYNPQGARVGLMLRAGSVPTTTHFYGEIIGTAGKAYDTGVVEDKEESRATELMFGGNIGVNFITKNDYFFGIYTGFSIGQLDFDDQVQKKKITKFQFGLTYHLKI